MSDNYISYFSYYEIIEMIHDLWIDDAPDNPTEFTITDPHQYLIGYDSGYNQALKDLAKYLSLRRGELKRSNDG